MPINELRPFATPRQLEYLDAIATEGSNSKAALKLGIDRRTIDRVVQHLKREAVLRGHSPEHNMVHTVPEGYMVKGVSTYFGEDGKPKGQWVKSSLDAQKQQELVQAVYDGLAEDLPRLPATVYTGSPVDEELLNCFIITDYHLGALSWQPETGAEWDLEIAERTIIAWFERAIEQSPNAHTALFAQLSDFLHTDSFVAQTVESKHPLDAAGRYPHMARIAIRVIRRVIDMLLVKHEKVHIIMADANHDPVSQVWLREWISVLYEENPRVTVDTSPSPYNAYEFGKVAVFMHHGHKRGVKNVSEVFASQFREMFGRTKHAYAHLGHLHHVDVKENNLMIVEQHRTLAAPDAYSARGGWISGRDAKVITYHKEFGEVGRVTVSYDAVAA